MEELCKLNVLGVARGGSRTGFCSLILESETDHLRLQIVIGTAEANAIECSLRGITPPRPLTQDIMARTMECFALTLKRVVLYMLSGEIFGATLTVSSAEAEHEIDARSSDAIALALRMGAPIYATRKTMEKSVHPDMDAKINETVIQARKVSGRPLPRNSSEQYPATEEDFMSMTIEELDELLRRCVAHEQYEKASLIKDIIKRKNTSQ